MNPVIAISDLEYYYGKNEAASRKVLTGINLSVEKGELLALIGATGSGKTTLLQIMAGLLLPKSGQVNVLGLDLGDPELKEKDLDKHRRRVAIALQRPEEMLFRTYVGDDVAYGPANYGLEGRSLALRVKEAMEAAGLPYSLFKDRRTDSLSGGEMRKAALAGVLALKPEILLLDEPAAGLDPEASRELFRRIQDLHNEGVSIVFSTHDMDQVMLADRAAVCSAGRLVAVQPPEELFFIGDLAEKNGLLAPEAARIYRHLKSMGIDAASKKGFPGDPESLADWISAAFFKGAAP